MPPADGAAQVTYRLLSLLGEGGMGRVYRAEHHPSGRVVALKRLRPELAAEEGFRRLLLEEATAASRLAHENLVGLLEIGADAEGTPFLVMEFFEGASLYRAVHQWPGWSVVARALDGVLAGLAAAHAAGIIHRDLKPENVLVDGEGTARILDFGVACVVEPTSDASAVRVAGTPAYMPPEQLRGEPARPTTDLYAVGGMLFELLTGELAIEEREDLGELLAAKERGPRALRPREGLELPAELVALVLRLLAPSAAARPRFAREVRDALARLAPLVKDAVPRAPTEEAPRERTLGDLLRTHVESKEPARDTLLSPEEPPPAPRPTEAPPPEEERLPASPLATQGASLLRLREPAFVGRQAEREALEREVRWVQQRGRARVVLLLGRSGVGKSRLARWLLASLEAEGTMENLSVGFDASGARRDGLRQAVLRLLGAPGSGEVGARWGWLLDAGATQEELVRLAGWLLEQDATATTPAIAAELAWTALSLASKVRPVALWLDDLGWSHDGALELVELLVARPAPAVLVLATMRQGSSQHPRIAARLEALAARLDVRALALEELAPRELQQLVSSLARVPKAVAKRLARAAQGAPLLAVELLHDWLECGALVPGEEGFALAPEVDLETLVAERPVALLLSRRVRALLEGLGDAGAQGLGVLLRAALLGLRFSYELLRRACARASAEQEGALGRVLSAALLHGLLRAEEPGTYGFEHATLREAVLAEGAAGSEGAERVRRACLDAAAALVDHPGVVSATARARGAALLRRAGERERALVLLVRALREHAYKGDDESAAEALLQMQEWLDEDGVPAVHPERARATWSGCLWDYYAGRYDASLAGMVRARGLFNAVGDTAGVHRTLTLEATILYYQGRYRASYECARSLLEGPTAAVLSLDEKMHLEMRLADLLVTRDDLDGTLAHVLRACAYSEEEGTQWNRDLYQVNLAEVRLARGELAEAAALLEPLWERWGAAHDYVLAEDIAGSWARLCVARGRAAEVAERVGELLRASERRGSKWRITSLRLLAALCAASVASGEAARASVQSFFEAFASAPQDEAYTVWGLARLGVLLSERGERECAQQVAALLARRRGQWAEGWR